MLSTLDRRTVATSQAELDTKLQLLQDLCLHDIDPLRTKDGLPDVSYLDLGSDQWIEAEYKWALEQASDSVQSLHSFDEDEDMDACSPSVYDPTLFSSPPHSPSTPTPHSNQHQRVSSDKLDKEKPLPDIPRVSTTIQRGNPSAPPPSPQTPPSISSSQLSFEPRSSTRSSTSTSRSSTPPRSVLVQVSCSPPASPRISSSAPSSPRSRTFPRSASHNSMSANMPPPNEVMPRPNAIQRHATYPSITSTLELVEERDADFSKYSGVTDEQTAIAASRSRSASIGHTSSEAVCAVLVQGVPNPKPKQRPTLPTLSMSSSSPQLRTLASASSAATATPSPLATRPVIPDAKMSSSVPFSRSSEDSDGESPVLASRWSLDTVASRPTQASFQPLQSTGPDAASQSALAKGRKRDRLMSFISRGRSGSLGKGTPPVQELPDGRRSVSGEPLIVVDSARPSFSDPPPLPPSPATLSLRASTSTSSSLSSSPSSSGSALATPIDSPVSRPSFHSHDPFAASSPSSIPKSFGGSRSCGHNPGDEVALDVSSLPPQPTLPLPSPSIPSPSFLSPPRPPSFFSSLALRRRVRRRGKKLVITGMEAGAAVAEEDELAQERSKREGEVRYHNVVRWCENFGAIRKVDRRPDGSIHVYWREWEVADMVCRVQAQVFIKEVGRVSLAWHYIS